MIRFLDKDGPYDLPTGWHEVTTRQYCELDAQQLRTVEARASYFAGRRIQVNGLVADALAFLLHEPPLDGGAMYPANLGSETYLQVELLRAAIGKQPLHACYWQLFGIFTACSSACRSSLFSQSVAQRRAERCLNWKITETYPAVHHCLSELQRLQTKYAKLAEECSCEPCAQAKQAGVSRFEGFSYMNVLDAVAQHFHTDMDTVAQWPADTVYMFLLKQRMEHEYHVDLQRVQKGNNA